MTVMAWLSLLVAVFSMSAVGPMFLYLEKRGLTAMRAVFWRQTIQVLSSLLPMLLEHLWTPKSERAWWHLRVMQGKDEDFALEEERRIAREKEQRRRARRLAQGECEEESAQSQSHQLSLSPVDADGSMPKRPSRLSRKRRGAYAAAATSDGGASPSSTGAGAVERRGSNSDLTLSLEGDDDFDGSSQSPQQHHHQLQAPTPARVAGRNVWQSLFVISFCWFASVSLWVIALPYTSAARASLFSSLYPLFVICYLKLWRKVPVSAGEFGGVAVCVAGIAISELMASLAPDTNTMAAQAALQARQQRDAAAAAAALNSTALNGTVATIPEALLEDSHAAFLQFIGDALCVLGSIFIAYNVLEGSPCRKAVPLFAYTTITSVGCWIFLLVATVSLEGTTLSMHPVDGAFGWLADTEMTVRIILFGFLVGMVGISGFNFAVAHMSPILFSTVQLLDPGLAGIMSAMFGIEGWPVGSTYLGVGLVTAGIFLVVLYQTRRETEAEQTRAEEKRRMEMDSDDEDEGEGKGKELHEVREKDLDLHDSSSTLRPRRPSIRQISISDHKDEEAELDAAAMELSAHGSGGGGRGSGRGDGFVAIGRTASDSLGDEDEDVDVDGDVRSPRTKKGRGRAAAYSRVEMQTVANSPASLQHEA
jgi:drug/metabolite transporter (DMT)-like permease